MENSPAVFVAFFENNNNKKKKNSFMFINEERFPVPWLQATSGHD